MIAWKFGFDQPHGTERHPAQQTINLSLHLRKMLYAHQ